MANRLKLAMLQALLALFNKAGPGGGFPRAGDRPRNGGRYWRRWQAAAKPAISHPGLNPEWVSKASHCAYRLSRHQLTLVRDPLLG